VLPLIVKVASAQSPVIVHCDKSALAVLAFPRDGANIAAVFVPKELDN